MLVELLVFTGVASHMTRRIERSNNPQLYKSSTEKRWEKYAEAHGVQLMPNGSAAATIVNIAAFIATSFFLVCVMALLGISLYPVSLPALILITFAFGGVCAWASDAATKKFVNALIKIERERR
jgi:VIT1/CCC1 family predicted Fe2+/Mn2+ transporter